MVVPPLDRGLTKEVSPAGSDTLAISSPGLVSCTQEPPTPPGHGRCEGPMRTTHVQLPKLHDIQNQKEITGKTSYRVKGKHGAPQNQHRTPHQQKLSFSKKMMKKRSETAIESDTPYCRRMKGFSQGSDRC